jgi:hypothetical protein
MRFQMYSDLFHDKMIRVYRLQELLEEMKCYIYK